MKLFILFFVIVVIIWLFFVLFLYCNLRKGFGYVISVVENLIFVVYVIFSIIYMVLGIGLFMNNVEYVKIFLVLNCMLIFGYKIFIYVSEILGDIIFY